ncbi:MAG: T9SS type A sorting domain-containing protein [Bacteroidales bacterium]|nr:T9SS type A sorting domain-containing protein [Bacteroidales bacterium]
MDKTILLAIAMLLSGVLLAQENNLQVVGSSGADYATDNYQISWTIGESVISMLQSDNYILTQGFHQTSATITRIDNEIENSFDLQVFPNPTTRFVNIQAGGYGLTCYLYDMSGRLIYQQEFADSELVLDLSYYAIGTYLLNLTDESGSSVARFKIVKK